MARAADKIVTVSQLNRLARLLLEQDLPSMWVSGEISNLARPASGHLYFSLKDERAQVRCALFRSAGRGLRFNPANGDQVLVRGRVSIYEPRGDYQLILEHMEPAGEGLLRRRLEELKQKLAAEGLFDTARKRPLPALPRCIGVITSRSGAALRDILHILRRRFPAVPVILYPVQVQGEPAKHDIVAALDRAAARAECDVLILARGGGSLEDLWAFNEEMVVRAIARCPIPVVAGIGHEIDVTLADLVADVRAPTPSGAAELVVPDREDWLRQIARLEQRIGSAARRLVGARLQLLARLERRLGRGHPGFRLRQDAQRLDELRERLAGALGRRLALDGLRLRHARARLKAASPGTRLQRFHDRLLRAGLRLKAGVEVRLRTVATRLAVAGGRLHAVSPLSTLERGYAILQDPSGQVVRRAGQVRAGDTVTARLAEGALEAVVKKVSDQPP